MTEAVRKELKKNLDMINSGFKNIGIQFHFNQ